MKVCVCVWGGGGGGGGRGLVREIIFKDCEKEILYRKSHVIF